MADRQSVHAGRLRNRHRETESRGRLIEERKTVCRMVGRESRKKGEGKAPRVGKIRGQRRRELDNQSTPLIVSGYLVN